MNEMKSNLYLFGMNGLFHANTVTPAVKFVYSNSILVYLNHFRQRELSSLSLYLLEDKYNLCRYFSLVLCTHIFIYVHALVCVREEMCPFVFSSLENASV